MNAARAGEAHEQSQFRGHARFCGIRHRRLQCRRVQQISDQRGACAEHGAFGSAEDRRGKRADWAGWYGRRIESAVVIASGPSASDTERFWRGRDCTVVAVSDGYRIEPDAGILYAADYDWWRVHADAIRATCEAETWAPSQRASREFGCRLIEIRDDRHGLSADPGYILRNLNSGAQAVNLAVNMGARSIFLVGFDMRSVAGKSHFFGDHPRPLRNHSPYPKFVEAFRSVANDCAERGIALRNLSSVSALDFVPFVSSDDAARMIDGERHA